VFDLQDLVQRKKRGEKNEWRTGLYAAWYTFFDKGISLEEFERLPLPYILAMLNKEKELAEKAEEKSSTW